MAGSETTKDTGEARVALITGASRGLGEALAEALADRGWTLLLTARGARDLDGVKQWLSRRTYVMTVQGDIAEESHRRAVAEEAQRLGGLDVVVNNAGILGTSPLPAMLEYPLKALEEVFRINTLAPLALLQDVRSSLRPGARILNITSDAAIQAYPGWGGYGASKAALEAWSAVLGVENPDLKVYQVDPGDMRTRMHQEAFPGEDIRDRPLPVASVPGLLQLIDGDLPSGRYIARELAEVTTTGGPA